MHNLMTISFGILKHSAEDTDEEDIQELASQTSPIVQVFHLSILLPPGIYLILVFSNQI